MGFVGNIIIYLIMICTLLGAVAAIRDPEKGLGAEFISGLHSIGPVFIPVAGIMAAIPYLSGFITWALHPLFTSIGSDPSIAATAIVAVDMGGYQLADVVAASRESWIMAMLVGYTSGATVVYLIPVGLAMLKKKYHKYLALGSMAGFVSIPVAVIAAYLITVATNTPVRETITTVGAPAYHLVFNFKTMIANLAPLVVFCLALSLGLKFKPNIMIKGFLIFGRFMDAAIKIVLACVIIEYFTGFFSTVFGSWGFDPIIADEKDNFRALEIAGYIGIMLAGTFPMVFLIKKYMSRAMHWIGGKIGMTTSGATGFLMVFANIIATYHLADEMRPRDLVLCIAFAVCAQAALGDHLAFSANFQPAMIVSILAGKLIGGAFAVLLALKISVPSAERLEVECGDWPVTETA
ncbi:MAG: ethanolamine utilization protein EutH [Candidatus Adiutrix sp.]|jgi:ethanolamine transporter|nr:ethanolamine utilization protein EutH [Candidatus Adiutrix sp.]